MSEFNPYAAPEAPIRPGALVPEPDEGLGVFRDGKVLVMSRFATLPGRCVRCNAPATCRINRRFRWHPAAYYTLLLVYPLTFLYPILYWFVCWRAKVRVPLCAKHRSRRLWGCLIGLGISLAGLGISLLPALFGEAYELAIVPGTAFLILGAAWAWNQSRVLGVRKIDRTHVWLKRVGPAYLADLPEVPQVNTIEVG